MADLVWGSSALSDEETARALCAFRHTTPLPTQRRRPLQQQPAPLYQRRNGSHEMPQLMADADGLSAFGYPTNGTYHMCPVSARRTEAASVLVGMHAPSTSNDDWHRQQQRAIQVQIEQQQRELQAQIQQQQQRDMQVQLQLMQTQLQQQEQAQRQQRQGIQHSTEQVRWHTSQTTNFHDGGKNGQQDFGLQMQQPHQLYEARFGRSQQLPARSTTVSTSTPSFVSDYRGSSQAGVSRSRSEGMFAPQQVPQPTQSHLQARNPENFAMSALHQWGSHVPTSFTGVQTDRTPAFQMQATQRFLPQQPQPYRPAEITERSQQVAATLQNSNRSRPDGNFLNGSMKHFSTNVGTSAGVSAGASYGSNASYAEETRSIKPTFNPISAQARFPTEIQMQGHLGTYSKLPIPPTGTAVVPGVSLSAQSARLLTMRDILNGDDGSNKAVSARNRGVKQKRSPPKRKIPRKNPTAKRQRTPKQPNERRFQPPPTNRPAGSIQSRQGAGSAPTETSGLVARPSTPMYRAFMESRAARALEQTVGHASTTPTTVTVLQLTPATRSAAKSVSRSHYQSIDVTVGRPNLVKRKQIDASPGVCLPSNTYTSDHPLSVNINLPPQAAAKAETVVDKGVAGCFYPNATESFQRTSEHHTLVDDQVHVEGDFDISMNGASEHQQYQQIRPKLAVPQTLVSSVQRSVKVEAIKNGKTGAISKKRRRAKLPMGGSTPSAASAFQQQAPTIQLLNVESSTVPASISASAVTSSSAVQTPAVAGAPPVANRTVVIFCKRDFMRYQAAKIWRKYQEQLKKHEEWREVRVAGKRTRYLNSRYDDELQKTHRRTYTRSGKPRRTASQVAKGSRSHKALLSTADSALVNMAVSSSTSVGNEGERNSTTTDPGQIAGGDSAGSGTSFNEAHSSSAIAGVDCSDSPVAVQVASEVQQNQPSTLEGETTSAVESSASKDRSSGTMRNSTDTTAHPGLDATAPDGNLGGTSAGLAPKDDVVAVMSSNGNIEVANATSEATSSTPDALPENVDPTNGDASTMGNTDVADAAPDSDIPTAGPVKSPSGSAALPIAESLSNCTIEVTSSELDSSVGNAGNEAIPKASIPAAAVAEASSNGEIETTTSTPDCILGSSIAETASVDVIVSNAASDCTMETDTQLRENTEEYSRDNIHPCEEQTSVENGIIIPEQNTSVAEDKHACIGAAALDGTPSAQPACPATNGVGTPPIAITHSCPDPAAQGDIDQDKTESLDGVKRNIDAATGGSFSDVQRSGKALLTSSGTQIQQ